MPKILVTGGAGYIGSHTITDLVENGFDVISIDNFCNGYLQAFDGIKAITGKAIKNYNVDLCDFNLVKAVFEQEKDIEGIIHFAALKSVSESVEKPLEYYHNNLLSLINVLKCCKAFNIKQFVFSSSCTVYGNPDELPVTEESPIKEAESPYGATKQMGERIINDFSKTVTDCAFVLLRYFNPVGAHNSAKIGEFAIDKPENLVPIITQTASGLRNKMMVYGNDYDTRDGSCIRDYIHVSDIAEAHTMALQYIIQKEPKAVEVFNLGTGNGVTVLELIEAFEKISGIKLNYEMGERRPGDVEKIYANNTKVKKVLGWNPTRTIDVMMRTAWAWQQNLNR